MIPGIIEFLELGIVLRQAQQLFLAEFQVVEFVFEDDARLQQSLLNDGVARGLLFVSEGNLSQIKFAVMGVVGEGVFGFGCLRAVVRLCALECQRIAEFIGQSGIF